MIRSDLKNIGVDHAANERLDWFDHMMFAMQG